MPSYLAVIILRGQMYESKYSRHKKEIKVNSLTQNDFQNFINPLVVFKFDPKEPKLFYKSQILLKISSKVHFLLFIILSALDHIQKIV